MKNLILEFLVNAWNAFVLSSFFSNLIINTYHIIVCIIGVYVWETWYAFLSFLDAALYVKKKEHYGDKIKYTLVRKRYKLKDNTKIKNREKYLKVVLPVVSGGGVIYAPGSFFPYNDLNVYPHQYGIKERWRQKHKQKEKQKQKN